MTKESWTLLGVWTAYMPTYEFGKNLYVKFDDYKSSIDNLSELNRKQSKAFKSAMRDYRGLLRDYMKQEEENKKLNEKVRFLEECLDNKEKLNEKYRKEIEESHFYDAKQVRDIC